ncbi:hypothetical protein, partial [Campylobacter insulaenigrae]
MKSVLLILEYLGYSHPSYISHKAKGIERYYQAYLATKSSAKLFLDIFDYGFEQCDKYFMMIKTNLRCIHFVRDPICILETYINAKIRDPEFVMKIDINSNLNKKLNLYKYVNSLEAQKNCIFSRNMGLRACFFEYSIMHYFKLKDTYYVDFNQLKSENIIDTFNKILNFLDISLKVDGYIKNINFGYSCYLDGFEVVSSKVSFFIVTFSGYYNTKQIWKDYKEVTEIISNDFDMLDFKIFIKSSQYNSLTYGEIIKAKKFFRNFILEFQNQVNIEKSKKVTPAQYLIFLFEKEKKEKIIKLKE